ncbi:MAG TPA: choice-of-anchor tandem repeat GloVer-containing protein, partial [Tepidisphaeraceae bacterium]
MRRRKTPGSHLEGMEGRLLLSAYALSQVGYVGGNSTGMEPQSTLVADAEGNLYGTATLGGAHGAGTVFEVVQNSGALTTLASFNGANGKAPFAGVVLDVSGNLFGTTTAGGTYGDGNVFEIARGSNAITTVAEFNGNNGALAYGGVTLDGAGNLFGATSGGASGNGTLFEVGKGSSAITDLHYFYGPDGANPNGPLTFDAAGNLYGTTRNGGVNGQGTVFEMASGSGAITTLGSFNGYNGSSPLGSITVDASGNVFGTTSQGGALYGIASGGYGSVFEIANGSNTVTTLASFTGTNGSYPSAGPILDGAGDLYGTTQTGGANGRGTLFEIGAGSFTITTLATFNGTNGGGPAGALTPDAAGNFFGTSESGGVNNQGTVFELAKGSSVVTDLASFLPPGGANPFAGVTLDATGNLYGTTITGGASNLGTVFEIANGSNAMTTLASLNQASNWLSPPPALTLDAAGNLFGTTATGGYAKGDGTVFEIPMGSS